MQKLRWGIVGTGNIAGQFAEGVLRSDRTELAAVASRNAESASSFASRFRIGSVHGDYQSILSDKRVDAIYLSLPNSMHHEWTIRALTAGKHVLCEKPLASSMPEAAEMFAAAKASNRRLVEAFMYRAHPQTRAIVDAVRRGAVGTVKNIRTSFCYRVRNWQGNIRFSRELQGGAMMDVGCYCVNFSRLIAGCDPVEVRAVATMHESGVDEMTTVAMRYPNGITANFTVGMMLQADNSAHICGDEGYLVAGWPWKPAPPSTNFVIRGAIPPRQDATAGPPVAPEPKVIEVNSTKPLYAIEADAFADTVLNDAEPFTTEVETLGVVGVLEEIERQIRHA
jgi:predicted dehydrogenase